MELPMDCPNCISATDYWVFVAAKIAEWLLIAASATAVGIRVVEWWQRQNRPTD